jgi:hypothetical protein
LSFDPDGVSDEDRDDADDAASFARLELELSLSRWGPTGDSGEATDPPIVEFDDAAARTRCS